MGRIGRVLDFVRRVKNGINFAEVQSSPGREGIITPQHFSAPGDDSAPLPTDYDFIVDIEGSGRAGVLGYIDAFLAGITSPGEKRIYARDSAGVLKGSIYLKRNGDIVHATGLAALLMQSDGVNVLGNPSGGVAVAANGDVDINGVIITAAGVVTVPTSLSVAGKELAGHDHAITGGSSAPGPTGPNN